MCLSGRESIETVAQLAHSQFPFNSDLILTNNKLCNIVRTILLPYSPYSYLQSGGICFVLFILMDIVLSCKMICGMLN